MSRSRIEMLDADIPPTYSALPGQQTLVDASHLGFPSPADESPLGVCPSHAVDDRGPAHAPSTLCDPFCQPTLPDPFPAPAFPSTSIPTPLQENQPDLAAVGFAGNLPLDASLPTPPILKAGNLRLPSFDLLGIGAPHPDRMLPNSNERFAALGAGPLSKPEDPLHALSPPLSRPHPLGGVDDPSTSGNCKAAKGEIRHFIPIVTPPAEPGTINWGSFVNVRTAAMGSPASSGPDIQQTITPVNDIASPLAAPEPPITQASGLESSSSRSWINEAKDIITGNLESLNVESVKVLSHALPCPSRAGHTFPIIIDAIHSQTPDKPTSWINVFHAVPGRFNMADLPTSPPSTPGPAVGGDDYFTGKVFDSAVAVSDYQGDSKLLPSSPRPVVAPATVNVSIVERYIPPTNVHEFAEMFNLKGRSLLMDRLIELSPNNGSLLFIYPTRTGARNFMNQYLGPILDPLLRSMAVVHNLSADLGTTLGHMASVDRLIEFGVLTLAIEKFCEQLSTGNAIPERFHNKRSKYSIVYSSKEEVPLDRDVWASDWWIKQEKPRVRSAVTKYFRIAQKLSSDSDVMPTNLIQDILDGVAKKPYESKPTRGIEVGVYVIQRSQL